MQKTATKLHPHLKAFIRNVVLAEMVGPSESYLYKEELMKRIQAMVFDKIGTIQTQEELAALIDQAVADFHKLIEEDLDMIRKTLRMVPVALLKSLAKR